VSSKISGSSPPSASVGRFWGELLTECETAELLRLSQGTLRYWRRIRERRGPPFVKIERLVRYRVGDLNAYLRKRTVRTGARK
jgi:hypothetical protein